MQYHIYKIYIYILYIYYFAIGYRRGHVRVVVHLQYHLSTFYPSVFNRVDILLEEYTHLPISCTLARAIAGFRSGDLVTTQRY